MSKDRKQEFINWQKNKQSRSAIKYAGAIDTITKELNDCNLITNDIYSINNAEEINEILNKYLSVPALKDKNVRGDNMYSCALKKYREFLKSDYKEYDLYVSDNNIDNEIKNIEDNLDKLNKTEKLAIIKSRIGQNNFKNRLVKKYKKCFLCDIAIPELLIASHIKPWSESNSMERLDINNGLLLCCLHDKLFDLGFISFDDSGKIIISGQIDGALYKTLKINTEEIIEINTETRKYLNWHKENKLRKDNPGCT